MNRVVMRECFVSDDNLEVFPRPFDDDVEEDSEDGTPLNKRIMNKNQSSF